MAFSSLPSVAAWRHLGSRTGFEAVSFQRRDQGWVAAGSTTAVENGCAWWLIYEIELDASFRTQRATLSGAIGGGPSSSAVLESDGLGSRVVDGRSLSLLDGCLDVDLESSAMTNALPLRRLSPGIGDAVQAPAAFVRVEGLDVQRLEQRYVRLPDESHGPSFDYEAPAFAFACRIDYDASGLVVSYPEIAERVA